MEMIMWGWREHGITHTNVLPRLGISADFTRPGLHGTLVVNSVLANWRTGKKVRALAGALLPLFSILGVRKDHSLKKDM
jgi:hypothetical protein